MVEFLLGFDEPGGGGWLLDEDWTQACEALYQRSDAAAYVVADAPWRKMAESYPAEEFARRVIASALDSANHMEGDPWQALCLGLAIATKLEALLKDESLRAYGVPVNGRNPPHKRPLNCDQQMLDFYQHMDDLEQESLGAVDAARKILKSELSKEISKKSKDPSRLKKLAIMGLSSMGRTGGSEAKRAIAEWACLATKRWGGKEAALVVDQLKNVLPSGQGVPCQWCLEAVVSELGSDPSPLRDQRLKDWGGSDGLPAFFVGTRDLLDLDPLGAAGRQWLRKVLEAMGSASRSAPKRSPSELMAEAYAFMGGTGGPAWAEFAEVVGQYDEGFAMLWAGNLVEDQRRALEWVESFGGNFSRDVDWESDDYLGLGGNTEECKKARVQILEYLWPRASAEIERLALSDAAGRDEGAGTGAGGARARL